MASMTRAEYDRRREEGLGMPMSFDLIEPDGTTKFVFNTAGAAAAVENPRLKNRTTRDALTLLADLVEYHDFGRTTVERQSTLSDFIDSGHAYKQENDAQLQTIVSPALAQLQSWINSPSSRNEDNTRARLAALQTVVALRVAGFA